MINFATIHEDKLTRFQRNHYIISISDLHNKSSIGHEDIHNEEHITIETIKKIFPHASTETVAGLLLLSIKLKIIEGETQFLLTFTDETKPESLDLLNGLIIAFQLEATTEDQQRNFEILRTYAGKWTKAICRKKSNISRINSAYYASQLFDNSPRRD
ncbi:hypothetical protein [Gracilibacillus sp. Marseille-QA3620]